MHWTFTLADLILTALGAALFGCLIARWVGWSRRAVPVLPQEWAISARPALGRRERRLYHRLRSAFPQHLVLPKLALVRFCRPDDASMGRYWHSLLASSHVTFAVCCSDGTVVLAIDLEGDRPRSRRSLQIRQCVLSACGVKYLRVSAQQMPGISELRSALPSSGVAPKSEASQEIRTPPLLDIADALATTVAARGGQRKPRWHESSLFQDSFFSSSDATGSSADPASRSTAWGTARPLPAAGSPESPETDPMEQPLTMGR